MINVVTLKGARADSRIQFDGDSLFLPATANATGAAFQEWMGEKESMLSFRVREFSDKTCLVICIHRGEEYGKGLYQDCVEWTISEKEITLRTPEEVLFQAAGFALTNGTEVGVAKVGDRYILHVDDEIHEHTHVKIPDGAKLILYNEGNGNIRVDNIRLQGFVHPRRNLERTPGGSNPRPEYPRPDMKRDTAWQNLNGPASFVFDPYREGEAKCWFHPENFPHLQAQTILIPFPWQAPFSQIHEPLYHGDAWYYIKIKIQQSVALSDRIFLRFGAVDYECQIWLDGQKTGEHHNGYLSFELDVTNILKAGGEHILIIQTRDRAEDRARLLGKQGTWYNHVSGIWQSFWLEGRPAVSLAPPSIRADKDALSVRGSVVGIKGPIKYQIRWTLSDETGIAAKGLAPVQQSGIYGIEKAVSVKPWSPDHPNLYKLRLTLVSDGADVQDEMGIQLGFRRFEARDGAFFLNGEEIYLRGVLNQAFHPDGLYTYPSDDVVRGDLETAKAAGYNLIRLHIKIDEPRLYYWADQLGMLIWAEPPSWLDDGYTNPPAYGTDIAKWPRESAKFRLWETIKGLFERDGHHACIVIWGVINEGWGVGGWSGPEISTLDDDVEKQEFLRTIMTHVRELDPSRPWIDNSACPNGCAHVESDILDYHDYADFISGGSAAPAAQYEPWRKRMEGYNEVSTWRELYVPAQRPNLSDDRIRRLPKMNSEYGAWPGRPWFSRDLGFSLQYLTNEIRRQPELKGYIYTELQDIAWELNGLLTYDRRLKDLGLDPLLTVNAPLHIGFFQPFLTCGSGETVVRPFVRDDRHDPSFRGPFQILFRLLEEGIDGREKVLSTQSMEWTSPKKTGPILLDPRTAGFSPEGYIRRADIQIIHNGKVLARNWVWLLPEASHPSGGTIELHPEKESARFLWRKDARTWVVHIQPGETAEFELATEGNGDHVVLEMSSDSALHRQTMPADSPAHAEIRVDSDNPKSAFLSRGLSDARGILSWANEGPHPGLYGQLVTCPMERPGNRARMQVTCMPTKDAPHGVFVFGPNAGRYPFASGIESRTTG